MVKDKSVNIGEARANFSELVERAASGEEIIISRAGTPRAKLVPAAQPGKRPSGIFAHLFTREEIDKTMRYIRESTNKEEEWPEFYEDSDS